MDNDKIELDMDRYCFSMIDELTGMLMKGRSSSVGYKNLRITLLDRLAMLNKNRSKEETIPYVVDVMVMGATRIEESING